ncbi:MAG: hypothetical protein WKF87_04970 [Chryseolinea sp.]
MKSFAKLCALITFIIAFGQGSRAQNAAIIIKQGRAVPQRLSWWDSTTTEFKQPAHVFPQRLSWWDSTYLYPHFQLGRITYITDFFHELPHINFNLYYAQMHMIDAHGDTIEINALKTFKSIQLGSDIFLVNKKKGFLRVLSDGELTLAAKIQFELRRASYVSGNLSAEGGETQGIDIRGNPSIYDKYYVLASTYFFVDAARKMYLPSKAVLLKMFPEYRSAINEYLATHPIDFFVENDLVKLTLFCNNLRHIPRDAVHTMIVYANESASQKLRDNLYRFPKFEHGVIVYNDGQQKRYDAALNYNVLSAEMEVIENDDTTKIRNSGAIATVNIDGTTYFKKPQGYIEILLNGRTLLGVTRMMSMTHSQMSKVSSKYSPEDRYDPTLVKNDKVNFERLFATKNDHYFIDAGGNVYVASISSLYRLNPSKKKQIDKYIALHQPNFRTEDDLKQIISYINEMDAN